MKQKSIYTFSQQLQIQKFIIIFQPSTAEGFNPQQSA